MLTNDQVANRLRAWADAMDAGHLLPSSWPYSWTALRQVADAVEAAALEPSIIAVIRIWLEENPPPITV